MAVRWRLGTLGWSDERKRVRHRLRLVAEHVTQVADVAAAHQDREHHVYLAKFRCKHIINSTVSIMSSVSTTCESSTLVESERVASRGRVGVLEDEVDEYDGRVQFEQVHALVRAELGVHAEPVQVVLQVARARGARARQLLRPEAAVRARADRRERREEGAEAGQTGHETVARRALIH